MWIVICDSEYDSQKKVFLTDRSIERTEYWTLEFGKKVMKFRHQDVAERVKARYRHGNPRVVHYDEAKQIAEANERL